MPTISRHLKEAAFVLQKGGVAEPRREAASLMMFTLEKDRVFLISHPDYLLSKDEEEKFKNFLDRRANREPFQYITGKQEFYGLDFLVNPSVLIPRPETEIIVEKAIDFLKNSSRSFFCEIGLGSGCIAVSILHNVKNASAIGIDISEEALAIARRNAEKHRVLNRLTTKQSNIFEALGSEKFDLIVSNPPYISASEINNLQSEVRYYEPLNALTDGGNGLEIIQKIINDAPQFLNQNGALILEIGFEQSAAVKNMLAENIWKQVEFFTDLQNIPRTIFAQLK